MTSATEAFLTELAKGQHGLVTRHQLLRAGVTPATIDYRVKANRLRPLHRGVYLVGPMGGPRVREMAAVLASGEGAVISHRSAAALWGLLPHPGNAAPVDVTVKGGDRGRRPGIRPHRVDGLEADEISDVEGVPTTAPARTLLDLSAVVSAGTLERALARAERRDLIDRKDLAALLRRHPGRRGVVHLRALLRKGTPPALTRSKAEKRFLALVRRSQLPEPEVNVWLAGYQVDFLWRREGIVVEVDGFAYHASKRSFEKDRLRDSRLSAKGFSVVRVTWRQIADTPEAVVARLAQALARSRSR